MTAQRSPSARALPTEQRDTHGFPPLPPFLRLGKPRLALLIALAVIAAALGVCGPADAKNSKAKSKSVAKHAKAQAAPAAVEPEALLVKTLLAIKDNQSTWRWSKWKRY